MPLAGCINYLVAQTLVYLIQLPYGRNVRRREKFWGISCEKYFFQIQGGWGGAPGAPPPLDPPLGLMFCKSMNTYKLRNPGKLYLIVQHVRFCLIQLIILIQTKRNLASIVYGQAALQLQLRPKSKIDYLKNTAAGKARKL